VKSGTRTDRVPTTSTTVQHSSSRNIQERDDVNDSRFRRPSKKEFRAAEVQVCHQVFSEVGSKKNVECM
jgi:hypothetical protein